MTRKLLLLGSALLAGCASMTGVTSGSAPQKTPAQIASQVCPVVQPTLASLQALVGLQPSIVADLGVASQVVATVCTVGSAVTTGNLQAMAGQVFPALVAAAAALPKVQQNDTILALSAAQIILNGALALNPPLTSLGTAVPASAPSGK